jgi:deoxycytidine triphosphate deaminase
MFHAELFCRAPPNWGEPAPNPRISFVESKRISSPRAVLFRQHILVMLPPDDLARQIDGLVHLDTQRAPNGLDLTVDRVYRTTGHGRLDFGGSEVQAAPREPLTPVLDDPGDDYRWWTLEKGAYIIEYNESLTLGEGQQARISPLERTLLAGAHHGTFVLDDGHDPLETLLVVTRMGCRLKENCRLSRLVVLA